MPPICSALRECKCSLSRAASVALEIWPAWTGVIACNVSRLRLFNQPAENQFIPILMFCTCSGVKALAVASDIQDGWYIALICAGLKVATWSAVNPSYSVLLKPLIADSDSWEIFNSPNCWLFSALKCVIAATWSALKCESTLSLKAGIWAAVNPLTAATDSKSTYCRALICSALNAEICFALSPAYSVEVKLAITETGKPEIFNKPNWALVSSCKLFIATTCSAVSCASLLPNAAVCTAVNSLITPTGSHSTCFIAWICSVLKPVIWFAVSPSYSVLLKLPMTDVVIPERSNKPNCALLSPPKLFMPPICSAVKACRCSLSRAASVVVEIWPAWTGVIACNVSRLRLFNHPALNQFIPILMLCICSGVKALAVASDIHDVWAIAWICSELKVAICSGVSFW